MAPIILTDGNGKVKIVVGATGGTKIPTATIMVLTFYNLIVEYVENIKNCLNYRCLYECYGLEKV